MYLMYVDESGDPGMVNSPSRYFVLAGVVVHERAWRATLEALVAFRLRIRDHFELKLREEVHAALFVRGSEDLKRIAKHDRLAILRHYADQLASLPAVDLIHIVVDKQGKPAEYDPFEKAWQALIQRFENTIAFQNFRGPAGTQERGMVFADGDPQKKLTQLLRRMRRHNPVPNQQGGYRSLELTRVLEDPIYRDSRHSLMIQSADLCAYLLYQRLAPNGYMRRKGGNHYFDRLAPILCRAASAQDPEGIVRL